MQEFGFLNKFFNSFYSCIDHRNILFLSSQMLLFFKFYFSHHLNKKIFNKNKFLLKIVSLKTFYFFLHFISLKNTQYIFFII
jgi:hypothetical protein